MESSVPQIPGVKCQPALAKLFRREVAQLLNRANTSFPGSQPVSFTRNHLDELQRRDYYLCEKTDGIRCLLYCTEDEYGKEIHYLIDRKNDYYFLRSLHFPHQDDPTMRNFHRATLIDGELVNDLRSDGTRRLSYLVFDCLVLDSRSLLHKPLDKRIGAFSAFVYQPYHAFLKQFPAALHDMPFHVKFKIMEKPYGLEMMFRDKLPSLSHGCDGLIFTCKETAYVTGTDERILKWKPPEENSIDFRLKLGTFPLLSPSTGTSDSESSAPGPTATTADDAHAQRDYNAKPDFDLYVFHGQNNYQRFDSLYITDHEWSCMKRVNQPLDGRIIECHKDKAGRWRYKSEPSGAPRFRDDKAESNHIETVKRILASIDDGVTQQDLLEASHAIYRAWKHRHPEENEAKRRSAQRQGPPPPPGSSG